MMLNVAELIPVQILTFHTDAFAHFLA